MGEGGDLDFSARCSVSSTSMAVSGVEPELSGSVSGDLSEWGEVSPGGSGGVFLTSAGGDDAASPSLSISDP